MSRYTHDCDNCIFLNEFENYDLYVCANSEKIINTVVARFGSDGPDYTSGLEFALDYEKGNFVESKNCEALYHALIRAKTLGFKLPEM